jgi:hypothetical protein
MLGIWMGAKGFEGWALPFWRLGRGKNRMDSLHN